MQRRLAEEWRAIKFDNNVQATPARPGGISYRNSIQRVVTISVAAATTSSLVFPSSSSSTASSASLSSAGSEVPTPSSGSESYKILCMEAFRDVSEIASHMVNDGYTEGLITEFSRRQRGSGGDAILRTWFLDLGVDWVLEVDEMNLQEVPWSAVEELIKRWVVGLTVMAEALRLTRPGLSDDGGSGGGAPLLSTEKYCVQRSAPAGAAALPAVSPGSSDLDQESSDPTGNRSFDVATVKEAIIAYSLAEKSLSFSFDQQGAGPESQFALFAKVSLMKMMRFPDAVAALKRSPEKILRMIDMYSLVSAVSPGLLALLVGESKRLVSDRIGSTLDTLSDAVRHILHNLISLIQTEDSWRTVQGDEIHPVNQYVLNYINLLLENCTLLNLILQRDDEVFPILYHQSNPLETEDSTSLTTIIVELINSLDAMLEDKSKAYAVAGQRYIFLLNNEHFILQQAERSLEGFLGTYWSGHRQRQIERHIKSYLDASWGPVVSCLEAGKQRRNSVFCKVSVLMKFNQSLQTTYHREKLWKIKSPQLRSTLRKSVSGKVISAYRAYLESHADHKTSCTYAPEDLEDLFQDLFEG